MRWWTGQPCQKQPSTNTATFCRVNATSSVRRDRQAGRYCTRLAVDVRDAAGLAAEIRAGHTDAVLLDPR